MDNGRRDDHGYTISSHMSLQLICELTIYVLRDFFFSSKNRHLNSWKNHNLLQKVCPGIGSIILKAFHLNFGDEKQVFCRKC